MKRRQRSLKRKGRSVLKSDNVLSGLGGTSGRGGSSRRRRMFRDTLVVTEFALAVVLLLSAGLLKRILVSLEDVEPGFSADNLITMRLSVAADKYPGSSVTRFYGDVIDRVEALPGVTELGMNCRLPLQGWGTRAPSNAGGSGRGVEVRVNDRLGRAR